MQQILAYSPTCSNQWICQASSPLADSSSQELFQPLTSMDPSFQNHSINDNCSSFDFISRPGVGCQMLALVYFCICAAWYHFGGILKSQLRTLFGMVFTTNFFNFWEQFPCSKVCFKLTSTAAARSPWNEPVYHQKSEAAAFDCSKQD